MPSYCKAADKWGKCTDCVKGYHLDCGKCVIDVVISQPVVDGCIQYGYIDQSKKWLSVWSSGCKYVCKVCDCDYYLTCNYTCALLPKYCKSADIYGNCTDCVKGYSLDCGKCVVDDHCSEYGWIDSANKWYTQFVKGCEKVCKCCEKGYTLNAENKCIKLPAFCEKVDCDGKCIDCCEGYKLCDGICIVDDHCAEYGWIDAGKKWYTQFVKGCQKVCKCCEKGYELCDGKCVEKTVKKDSRYSTIKGKN